MAEVRFDASGIRELALDFRSLSAEAAPKARGVIAKAGVGMKAAMRQEATGGTRRFSGVAPSIGYDLLDGGMGVEVGPEIGRRQGSLAFIAYYGSPTSGPQYPDPAGVLEREAPVAARFLAALGDL